MVSSTTPRATSPIPIPHRTSSSSPLHSLRLSLRTAFSMHHNNHHPDNDLTSPTSSSTSPSSSPSSSLRSRSPFTLHSYRPLRSDLSPSRSRSRSRSHTLSSPMIRRRPSKVDLALEEERFGNPFEIRGLELMEPRPKPVMMAPPVTGLGLGIGLGLTPEGAEYHGGHMGGIFEVMEGHA